MKKQFIVGCFLLIACFYQASYAASGLLFNVVATGPVGNVNITLCLNGRGALSCQQFTTSALNLNINTTIPNHTYPSAGIKINTPGYTLSTLGIDCSSTQNGYCLFSVSDTSHKNIYLYPPLGSNYGGGVVACLGGAPYMNLVVAQSDSTPGTHWGGFGISTGAQSTDNGAANSSAILQAGVSDGAASLCSGSINGYSDWFLPAKNQLNCLYTNQAIIPALMNAVYWSSTETDDNNAWFQFFDNGNQLSSFKSFYFSVRCVRALPS